MGTYFNPTNESFQKAINSRIYIDKTGLLEHTNAVLCTEENCIAVSHARRFGKSQAAGMIDAYYSLGSDSKHLFSKYEIAAKKDFLKHLNKYNVIHLDISTFTDCYKENLVSKIIEIIYKEMKKEYPEIMDISNPIGTILMDVYQSSGIPFVIIFDEWDSVIRNHADRPDLVHKYLQFLHSLFKSEESKKYLALAYITGILPIKKMKDESALNNFREYTMMDSDELTVYFGFTEEEVENLCRECNMDFSSIKEWYNGYLISGIHMYNPYSVYNAMVRHRLDSYWKNTSAFDTINHYISLNYDGLKEDILEVLSGGRIGVNPNTFKNDLSIIGSKDEVFTALIHLGYLGYDSRMGEAYVPNYEVGMAYQAALSISNWSDVAKTISQCDELLRATIHGDAGKVAELVELAHEAYTSVLKYNDENSLSCVLTMAYFTAPAYYTVIREFPSGKGFADFALIPRSDAGGRPAMIIELKWDESADSAITQIKERRYAGKLVGYGDKVLLVGINYEKNSVDKKHTCLIESIII